MTTKHPGDFLELETKIQEENQEKTMNINPYNAILRVGDLDDIPVFVITRSAAVDGNIRMAAPTKPLLRRIYHGL
jgi:hypothetical protein